MPAKSFVLNFTLQVFSGKNFYLHKIIDVCTIIKSDCINITKVRILQMFIKNIKNVYIYL